MKNKFLLLTTCCGLLVSGVYAQTPNFTYTQTCFGNQTTLVASSSLADTAISSWMWDVDGNGSYDLSGKTIITLVTINDTVGMKLKITPNSGSPDSITKNVIIDPLPQVNFMANNLCESKAAEYISQSSISSGSINQFIWDFNNDGTDDFSGNDTAYYTCGPAATYVTKLRCISDKGCSAFTQKQTTVYPNPVSLFSVPAVNVCVNGNALFTNNSTVTNLDFYLWNFGDGNSAVSAGNATHVYTTAGTFMVDLITISQAGCRDTASSPITIYGPPTVSLSGGTSICLGDSINLSASASGGTAPFTYGWTPSGTNPVFTTTYTVTVTDANGCSDDESTTVTVNPLPVVSITPSDSVLHNGGSVTLIANGAINYSWNTGANSISITTDSIGTYVVTGTDMNGCMASDSITISGENTDTVSVSGFVLTLNGDGINESFIINNISAYTNCDLMIYNMWNDQVYSVNGYMNDWKGLGSDGKQLPTGSYYYIIKCDDKPLLKGNINILR